MYGASYISFGNITKLFRISQNLLSNIVHIKCNAIHDHILLEKIS